MVKDDNKNDNNRDGEEEEEDEEVVKEDESELDDDHSMSEEMPAISVPGHTASPVSYEGPEFPVREIQPLPPEPPAATQSSDDMASRIKQADVLQREVVDWSAYCVLCRIDNC